jgi:hypothetical protein
MRIPSAPPTLVGEAERGFGLYLDKTSDDAKASYKITSVKCIGLLKKEVRWQAALEPALDATIRILPSSAGGHGHGWSDAFTEQQRRRAQEAEARARRAEAEVERIRRSKESFETMDPCALLGVSRTSTHDEVKAARRRLELVYHPDRSMNPESARMFDTIEKAYEKVMKQHPEWH